MKSWTHVVTTSWIWKQKKEGFHIDHVVLEKCVTDEQNGPLKWCHSGPEYLWLSWTKDDIPVMMDLIFEVALQYPNNRGEVIIDHINYCTQAVLVNESRCTFGPVDPSWYVNGCHGIAHVTFYLHNSLSNHFSTLLFQYRPTAAQLLCVYTRFSNKFYWHSRFLFDQSQLYVWT